jgi:hypothetical protein
MHRNLDTVRTSEHILRILGAKSNVEGDGRITLHPFVLQTELKRRQRGTLSYADNEDTQPPEDRFGV